MSLYIICVLLDSLLLGFTFTPHIAFPLSKLLKDESSLQKPYTQPKYTIAWWYQLLAGIGLVGLGVLVVAVLVRTLPQALNSSHVSGLYNGSGTLLLVLILAAIWSVLLFEGLLGRQMRLLSFFSTKRVLDRRRRRATSDDERQAIGEIRRVLEMHRSELLARPSSKPFLPADYVPDSESYDGIQSKLHPVSGNGAYLQPLVEAELQWGNKLQTPFQGTGPDGVNYCSLRYPLHVQRLQQAFDLTGNSLSISNDVHKTSITLVSDGYPSEVLYGASLKDFKQTKKTLKPNGKDDS